jgi:hypothetical protein
VVVAAGGWDALVELWPPLPVVVAPTRVLPAEVEAAPLGELAAVVLGELVAPELTPGGTLAAEEEVSTEPAVEDPGAVSECRSAFDSGLGTIHQGLLPYLLCLEW